MARLPAARAFLLPGTGEPAFTRVHAPRRESHANMLINQHLTSPKSDINILHYGAVCPIVALSKRTRNQAHGGLRVQLHHA